MDDTDILKNDNWTMNNIDNWSTNDADISKSDNWTANSIDGWPWMTLTF
jgi:hypothetical protein